eukprot:3225581-Alexandrium_andersonii.AAC.1
MDALAATGFVELGADLSGAVERVWGAEAERAGSPPYRRVCGDVWDLLRRAGAALRGFVGQ